MDTSTNFRNLSEFLIILFTYLFLFSILEQYVGLGQPLRIHISASTSYLKQYASIWWYYRSSSSTSFKTVLYISWRTGRNLFTRYDPRASLEGSSSLLLANTTLNDKGMYRCSVYSYYMRMTMDFDVTFFGKVSTNLELRLTSSFPVHLPLTSKVVWC